MGAKPGDRVLDVAKVASVAFGFPMSEMDLVVNGEVLTAWAETLAERKFGERMVVNVIRIVPGVNMSSACVMFI